MTPKEKLIERLKIMKARFQLNQETYIEHKDWKESGRESAKINTVDECLGHIEEILP